MEKKRIRYWCRTRERWATEYRFIWLWKIYKLEVFGKRTVWSFKASDNPMYAPTFTRVRITYADAVKLWGDKKYFWNYDWREKYTIESHP